MNKQEMWYFHHREVFMEINKEYDLESTLTINVKKYLNTQTDVYYFKASERYIKGVSDILCCCSGIFVAIELKAKNNEASQQQIRFIEKIVSSGGVGGICKSIKDVQGLLSKAREKI